MNDAGRLNERNRNYLSLGAGCVRHQRRLQHRGPRRGRARGTTSRCGPAPRAGTPLTVALQDADGTTGRAPARSRVKGGWAKYKATFTATRTSTDGRLTVASARAPPPSTGLALPARHLQGSPERPAQGPRREDRRAEAGLRPLPRRLPRQHRHPCRTTARPRTGSASASYQWKDTIGPVEQRATNANFWGYNQSYGLGYYEYFQFSEDIGAMPLPVVPALVTGCGQNRATDDDALLQRHIQDTLDLIEFANGPGDQRVGREARADGPPEALPPHPPRRRQRGEPAGRVLRPLPEVPRRHRGEVPRHHGHLATPAPTTRARPSTPPGS